MIAKAASSRSADDSKSKSVAMDAAAAGSAVVPSSVVAGFGLNDKDRSLTSQAHYYIYAKTVVAKQTFEDPAFHALLRGHLSIGAPFFKLTPAMLKEYVKAEFNVFQLFLKALLDFKFVHPVL